MPSGRRARFIVGAIGFCAAGLLMAASGCASQSAVSSLPAPSFQPPVVAKSTLPPAESIAQLPPMVNGVPRDWIPREKPRKWLWIVIHHTATPSGALARIDSAHRAKGWDCAGYDFVIGNGTESRDGQIEVGPRWPRQMIGAHTKSSDNRFNEQGIGIVMVGNFDETRPSKKQLEACAKLVAYMMRTYHIPADRVMGHKNTGRATDCPGSHTDVAQIRQMATRMLADAGEAIPQDDKLATGELMRDAPDPK